MNMFSKDNKDTEEHSLQRSVLAGRQGIGVMAKSGDCDQGGLGIRYPLNISY